MAQLSLLKTGYIITARKDNTSVVIIEGRKDLATPLDYLEFSIALCIGDTLKGICNIHEYDLSRYQSQVLISNNKLRIICSCPVGYGDLFKKAIETCYISNLIAIEKDIKITEFSIEEN